MSDTRSRANAPQPKARDRVNSSMVNDRIFMAFPFGWFAGVVGGAVYAAYHWHNLHHEFGRTLLVAVTLSQAVTLLMVTLIVRRIFGPKREAS